MRSASPLTRNDPRLPALVERLREGMSLKKESAEMGYAHTGQLRAVLKDMIGVKAYTELMSGRAKIFNVRNVPVASS